MKKIYTVLFALVIALSATGIGFSYDKIATAPQASTPQKQMVTVPKTSTVQPQAQPKVYISPLEVLAHQSKYLNKQVFLKAKFDKFSTLGLDYTPAMRTSADYIAFLVQRDDVSSHNIPLSEVKFFLKREYAEKFIELDTGDLIEIDGKMFSNALGDVWIDVNQINIKEKVKKADNK